MHAQHTEQSVNPKQPSSIIIFDKISLVRSCILKFMIYIIDKKRNLITKLHEIFKSLIYLASKKLVSILSLLQAFYFRNSNNATDTD